MAFDFSKVTNKVTSSNSKGQSNEALLLDYFKMRNGIPFESHDIQLNAVMYFRNVFGRAVQPDTLSRTWRALRHEYNTDRKNSTLYRNGMVVEELRSTGGLKKWRIIHE